MSVSLRVGTPGGEWLIAAGGGAVLALAVVFHPLIAVVAILIAAVALGLMLAGVSLTATAIGGVILGHLVFGQFYVVGALPESFAALLDLALIAVFLAVALRPKPRSPSSHVATVVFFGLAVIAVVNPLLPSLSYGAFGLRQVILPLVTLLVVKEAELSPKDIRFVIGTLVLGWAINVGFATRQWVLDFTPAEVAWIEAQRATYLVEGEIRLMGTMQSNQDFGFLAAVAVPAMTALFLAVETRLLRILFGVLTVLSFGVLFGSLLRTALVAGVVGAIVAAILASATVKRPDRLLAHAGFLAVLMLMFALIVPGRILPEERAETLSTRVASIFNPGADPSLRARSQQVWPRSIRIIGDNPLGGGPGAAGPLSQARPFEAPFGPVIPDNGYLLIGVQLGLIGVVLFLGMLLTWLRDLIAWVRRGQPAAAMAAGAVVAAMIAMIAGAYWSLVDPMVAFGAIVGLGLRGDGRRGPLGAVQDEEFRADPHRDGRRRRRLAGIGLRSPHAPPYAPAAPVTRKRRLLVVAAPMVSAGGVYSYLERALPRIGERDWETGLLWAARVPVEPLPADWSRPVPEAQSLRARQGELGRAVRAAIQEWRPDLVLSVLPQSDVACARVRRSISIPWVAMLHGNPFPRAGEMGFVRRIGWRGAVAVAYRQADGLITVSRALAETAERELSLPWPVTNVGTGVDLPESTERPQRELPTIGFLGRLSREKAPDVFLDIARRLGTKALIFGDGPLAGTVGAAAAQVPGLEYRGWSDRDQALAEIDLVVVPSRREALPLVVLEAGARRVCTIARDTGGIGEVMGFDSDLRRHCLLPRTATAEDFAGAIRHLLDNPDERERLADRLHAVVAEQFSLDAHIDRLLAAVEPVVARASAR